MAMKNVYFARALILELFGHDPEILGLDQTPIYMNECGSRKEGTLEIQGAPEVVLTEKYRFDTGKGLCSYVRVFLDGFGLAAGWPPHRGDVQRQNQAGLVKDCAPG